MSDSKTSLDPEDWDAYRRQLHDLADKMVDGMMDVGAGPVWRPVPNDVKEKVATAMPTEGVGTDETLRKINELILPYSTGNTHPRFMGWVHGGGTTGGVMAAMVEATMNSNVGGREHIAPYIEQQVIAWLLDLFGMPETGSGILTNGTSIATLDALVVARHELLGALDADAKMARQSKLKVYASKAVHSSLAKAIAIIGLSTDALQPIDCHADGSIDVSKLQDAINADHAQGNEPFAIVGTIGTVATGSSDNVLALADLAETEKLWLHIDGAFGALAILVPELKPLFDGIGRAHSIAFDFHKWGQVQYSCGCLLVHDKHKHRQAFSLRESYLAPYDRGLASADHWFSDYGPELSRSFLALRVWFLFQEHGSQALAASIKNSCDLAQYLAREVAANDTLELLAETKLNIVCFRLRPRDGEDANHLNAEIVADLHEAGIAAPSTVILDGQLAIRCCLVNHRITAADIDILLKGVADLAAQRRVKRE